MEAPCARLYKDGINSPIQDESPLATPDRLLFGNTLDNVGLETIYEFLYKSVPFKVKCYNLVIEAVEWLKKSRFDLRFGVWTDAATLPDGYNEENRYFFVRPSNDGSNILVSAKVRDKECAIFITGTNLEAINELTKDLLKFKIQSNSSRISVVASSNGSIYLHNLSYNKPKVNIGLNYGEGFVKIHESVIDKLNNRQAGLYLFYGEPGSGKSTYIKYLPSLVNGRKFVFVPTSMVDALVSPSLIGTLIDSPNCVLVLEDSERAVLERDGSSDSSLVSTILNLSDGILGSVLNTSIVLTFNTNRNQIDKALLRKGRLMVEHQFGKLQPEEANKLAKSLGKTLNAVEPMTLAEIYNCEEETFHKEEIRGKIGFA